jgi:hypothetical protein
MFKIPILFFVSDIGNFKVGGFVNQLSKKRPNLSLALPVDKYMWVWLHRVFLDGPL